MMMWSHFDSHLRQKSNLVDLVKGLKFLSRI